VTPTQRDRAAKLVFRGDAVINWIVTLPAFVAYDAYVSKLTDEKPNYPFLVWIWSGMAFVWGLMFWEIGSDPERKQAMVKYAIAEKAVTTTSVAVAYRRGSIPKRVLLMIVVTDAIWIPLFAWAARRARPRP
jgi:hypothetical protein